MLNKILEAQKTAKQSVSPYPTLPITTPDEANAPSSQSYSIDSGYASTYQQVKTVPFKITIPSNYENLEPWSVSISTLPDLRNFYSTARNEGCLGPCSILIENDNLEKQFAALEKLADQDRCVLTNEVRKNIYDFILFSSGSESKAVIETIYNDNIKVCGLKFIGQDGYDYWLGNYDYEAGFLKDGMVIEIRFELFPIGEFKEIDEIWRSIGYNSSSGIYSEEKLKKMEDYMENIDFESGVVKKIIDIYDKSVKSFELTVH